MKIARGQTKHLLIGIGKIQDLIGSAIGNIHNDRSTKSMDDAKDELDTAFQICLLLRGEYEIVEDEQ